MLGRAQARSLPLSLPREHGAYLTLAGAIAAGALWAPRPELALLAGLTLVAGFVARGPLERRAAGLRWRRWDRTALLVCALAAAVGAHVAAAGRIAVELAVLVAAAALPLLGCLVRRAGAHRDGHCELAAMGFMGGCAGLIAHAGGVALGAAMLLAVVLAAHAAASVPLVRTILRPRERANGRRVAVLTAVAMAVLALMLAARGAPGLALALLPRGCDAALRAVPRVPRRSSAAQVGLREVGLLLVVVVVLLLAAP